MRLLLFGLLTILTSNTYGQLLADSIVLQKGLVHAEAVYNRAMEGNFHIYNGSQYAAYQSQKDEHPYFLSDDWANGSILYDGEWFHNMPMLFDIEKNQVIVSYYFKGIKMQLNSQRVAEFEFQGHRFINYKPIDSIGIGGGFYEVLYTGKTKILALHSKKFIEEISGTDLTLRFKETTQYFLFHNNRFVKTGTKQAVLAALNSRKKELKAYMRRNRLFISEKENSLIRVVEYFDSLQP
jgi:hypothetical protein